MQIAAIFAWQIRNESAEMVVVIKSFCISFENELCLLGFNPHKTELMFVLYANNYSFRDFSLGNCNRPQNSNLIHDLVRFGND